MKYQCKKFKSSDEHWAKSYDVHFYNTPLSCVVFDEAEPAIHPGLNLTDDGEWIPAPGFERTSTDPGAMGGA